MDIRDDSFASVDLHDLAYDDDELTEDALRRITQMIDSRHEEVPIRSAQIEPHVLRECKIFMIVKAIDNVPSTRGCFEYCNAKYLCEVTVADAKQEFRLNVRKRDDGSNSDTLVNDNQSYFATDANRNPHVWNLAEFFGQTKIEVSIVKKKLFKRAVVGKKIITLSELLVAQSKSSSTAWSVDYLIPISTVLKVKKRKQSHAASSWLSTAKNASSSLSALPVNSEEGKPMIMSMDYPAGVRPTAYSQIPSDAEQKGHKGAEVVVHIEFRVVQFQNCKHLYLTRPPPSLAVLCSSSFRRGSLPDTYTPNDAASTTTVRMSELHFLAATAPPGVVVDVMRGLSRRDALAGTLALRTTDFVSPSPDKRIVKASAAVPALSRESSSRSERFGAASAPPSGLRSNAQLTFPSSSGGRYVVEPLASSDESPPASWTPLECALLHQQETTVLELLQRCGGLCFTNIAAGKASPLHTAVRGGSPQCVEYIGRYIKRYGTKSVTGTGARLWNSSLSAKLEWKDQQGDTALALACRLPRSVAAHSIVVYLLMLGADPAALNEANNFTPLMYACQSGAVKIASTLLSITKSQQDVVDAILNVGDVNSILNDTANLDVEPAVRDQIHAAIADAAHSARTSALAVHLQNNARSRNILRGQNILDGGYFNVMALYVCDPCRKDSATGRNAMHIAAEQGAFEIIQLLLDIHMPTTEVDFLSENAFHIAARRGHSAVLAKLMVAEKTHFAAHLELVRQGASLQHMHRRAHPLVVQNATGDSPVELAIEGGHFALAEDMLTTATEIYGTLDAALLRRLRVLLEEVVSRQTGGTPRETAVSVGLMGSSNKKSHRNESKQGALERMQQQLKVLSADVLSPSRADAIAGSAGQRRSAFEAEFIDNEADSVEYIMALSSLGMKYITDNLSSTSGLYHMNTAAPITPGSHAVGLLSPTSSSPTSSAGAAAATTMQPPLHTPIYGSSRSSGIGGSSTRIDNASEMEEKTDL